MKDNSDKKEDADLCKNLKPVVDTVTFLLEFTANASAVRNKEWYS